MAYLYDDPTASIADPDPAEVKQHYQGSAGPFLTVDTMFYQSEDMSAFPTDQQQDLREIRGSRADQLIEDTDPALADEVARLGGTSGIGDTERILATISGVDLTSAGITVLLTPIVGSRFTAIVIHPTTVTSLTVQPTIRVGRAAGGVDEYVFSTNRLFLTSGQSWRSVDDNVSRDIVISDDVRFEVTSGATATVLLATIYLMGVSF